jgi:diaminopropionate ammonia-lyase
MQSLANPFRANRGFIDATGCGLMPSVDAAKVQAMLARCPAAGVTPLRDMPELAERAGVAQFWLKDERGRMGLGSFKALGAAYVIACAAAEGPLAGVTYVTASAGNHGMSVAAGARVFGAQAVVYIAETVPESFAERLRAQGAKVVRAGADYAESMDAAAEAAETNGWRLLSDSSWDGYLEVPHRLMEGYLALADEIVAQIPAPASHVFLQAGVGGMAAAVAVLLRARWGDAPKIIVVEPEFAPALQASIRAGHLVAVPGPVSAMGRLDCKVASQIALAGLSHDADDFVTISEDEAQAVLPVLAGLGLESSASGAAGVAAALGSGLPSDARVLVILSEGAA